MGLCQGSDKQVLPGGVGVGDGMDMCGALRGVMLWSWGAGGEDGVSMWPVGFAVLVRFLSRNVY